MGALHPLALNFNTAAHKRKWKIPPTSDGELAEDGEGEVLQQRMAEHADWSWDEVGLQWPIPKHVLHRWPHRVPLLEQHIGCHLCGGCAIPLASCVPLACAWRCVQHQASRQAVCWQHYIGGWLVPIPCCC